MKKKSVAVNSVFNVIYKSVNTLFPLITTAYVARTLLPKGVGDVTYAHTIVSYFTLIAALGLPNYGIKAIARVSDDKYERSKTFFELITINTISTIICILFYYIFVNTIPYYEGRRLLFNISGITLILSLLSMDWFYQGIEEYKMISLRGMTVRAMSFLLIVLFIHTESDYLKYALILSVGVAGNNIYNAIYVRKYIDFNHYKLGLKKHMRPILILLASTIATEIYTMLDTVMLEYFHSSENVAYYSNAVKIVRAIYYLTISLATPIYPRISWYIRNHKFDESNKLVNRYAQIIYLIAVPASIGLITTAYRIIPILYGDQYFNSVSVVKILGILVTIFSTAYLFGHIILMAAGEEKKILRATVLGAISNLCLNLLLIPNFKENGAAIASICAELIVTTVLILHSRKMLKIQMNVQYIISLASSNAIMLIFIIVGNKIFDRSVLSTIAIIISAVVAYLLMLLVTRNTVILAILRKIKQKAKTS